MEESWLIYSVGGRLQDDAEACVPHGLVQQRRIWEPWRMLFEKQGDSSEGDARLKQQSAPVVVTVRQLSGKKSFGTL